MAKKPKSKPKPVKVQLAERQGCPVCYYTVDPEDPHPRADDFVRCRQCGSIYHIDCFRRSEKTCVRSQADGSLCGSQKFEFVAPQRPPAVRVITRRPIRYRGIQHTPQQREQSSAAQRAESSAGFLHLKLPSMATLRSGARRSLVYALLTMIGVASLWGTYVFVTISGGQIEVFQDYLLTQPYTAIAYVLLSGVLLTVFYASTDYVHQVENTLLRFVPWMVLGTVIFYGIFRLNFWLFPHSNDFPLALSRLILFERFEPTIALLAAAISIALVFIMQFVENRWWRSLSAGLVISVSLFLFVHHFPNPQLSYVNLFDEWWHWVLYGVGLGSFPLLVTPPESMLGVSMPASGSAPDHLRIGGFVSRSIVLFVYIAPLYLLLAFLLIETPCANCPPIPPNFWWAILLPTVGTVLAINGLIEWATDNVNIGDIQKYFQGAGIIAVGLGTMYAVVYRIFLFPQVDSDVVQSAIIVGVLWAIPMMILATLYTLSTASGETRIAKVARPVAILSLIAFLFGFASSAGQAWRENFPTVLTASLITGLVTLALLGPVWLADWLVKRDYEP